MKTLVVACFLCVALSCNRETVDKDTCVASPKTNCVCTAQYDPVCGCNKKTYSNACDAACNGIAVVSKGACTGQ
ncbi:MAG: hypothetical protein EAZ91_19660 [Cytophagales bacterium]|nr:MAG: hypothetical protein EAZ91_19660 [Cytophagales bacterium]